MPRFHLLLPLLLLAVGLAFALGWDRASRADAEQPQPDHAVLLHVTGEGPSAKAWYKGAPPTGVPVQDALDHFSGLGYRVTSVTPSSRPSFVTVIATPTPAQDALVPEQFFIFILER